MFYEEKLENGQWWYRTKPEGDWYPFTTSMYVQKISDLTHLGQLL